MLRGSHNLTDRSLLWALRRQAGVGESLRHDDRTPRHGARVIRQTWASGCKFLLGHSSEHLGQLGPGGRI